MPNYLIYEKKTGEPAQFCRPQATARKAWDYFFVHLYTWLKTQPGTINLSRNEGAFHYKNFFECRMAGTRAPVLKRSGHRLTLEWNGERGAESGNTGTCSCGWSESCRTQASVRYEYAHHLKCLNNVDDAPRPAERLPANKRVVKSLEKLKAEGGERKTFRLPEIAVKELDRMVTEENFPHHTAAVEALLTRRASSAPAGAAPIYPAHVDDPEVDSVVEEAVHRTCRELDVLFPGATPDGGKGVSSNFQGLLVSHIKAMLAGKPHARISHRVDLPVLLADDTAFGREFSLPDVQGAGYVVLCPSNSTVLDAYSGRFIDACSINSDDPRGVARTALFSDVYGRVKSSDSVSKYAGEKILFVNSEPDILFSSFDYAQAAALKAYAKEGLSPVEAPVVIASAVYDDADGNEGFRLL